MIASRTQPARMSKRRSFLSSRTTFGLPNARLGGVIDLFSRAGLSIIAFKVHYMSVAEAEEFYRPVLGVIMDKMREPSGKRARLAVEEEFGVPMDAATERQLGELIGPIAGRNRWETIVEFMAGTRPSQCPPEKRTRARHGEMRRNRVSGGRCGGQDPRGSWPD